ncbi:PfkB family carbohydrate kinase [Pseudoroseomonas wenyumeiae]
MTEAPEIDVVTLGRSSVDLYGQQIGGRLEDMASFAKAVGGSPTNIAVGAARLGLHAGLITRVGDEAFGRFIREQLEREGVDTRSVITDPSRLTALAIVGVRDDHSFLSSSTVRTALTWRFAPRISTRPPSPAPVPWC